MARKMNFAAAATAKSEKLEEELGEEKAVEKAAMENKPEAKGKRIKLTVNMDEDLRDSLKVWCAQNHVTMGKVFAIAAKHPDDVLKLA